MQSERRRIVRRPVRYPARVDIGDGSDLLSCMLVDASDEGVQIVTVQPVQWPDEIELVLGYGTNGRRRCRVAWRNGRQTGLEFLAKNKPLNLPAQSSQATSQEATSQEAASQEAAAQEVALQEVAAQEVATQPAQAAPREPEPGPVAPQPNSFDINSLSQR